MSAKLVSLGCATLAWTTLLVSAGPPGGGCGALPGLEPVGTGSGGAFGVPHLEGLGIPDISTPGSFSFRVSGGVPGAPGVLILARREQPLFSPLFGTTVYTGTSGVTVPFLCDSLGIATLTPSPTQHPISELCGLDLIAQATVFDFTAPGGAGWTNGLRFRFGTPP